MKFIFLFIAICLLLVCCTNDKQPTYNVQEITFSGDALIMQTRINAIREVPLKGEKLLTELCLQHCIYMDSVKQISHSGFNDRYAQSGAIIMGECCSYNYYNASSSFLAYEQSKSHLNTLINPNYTHMGYAKFGKYECVILAGYKEVNGKKVFVLSITVEFKNQIISNETIY